MRRRYRFVAATSIEIMIILAVILGLIGIAAYYLISTASRATGSIGISVTAVGLGSPDGSSATLTVTVKNTGTISISITDVYIIARSPQVTPGSVSSTAQIGGQTINVQTLTYGSVPPSPSTAGGGQLAAGASSTFTVALSGGQGLYSGAQLQIIVYGYDPGSKNTAQANTIVTLQ